MIKNESKAQVFPASLVSIAATLWAIDGIVLRPYLYNLPVPLVVFIETTIVAIILSPFFYKHRCCFFRWSAGNYGNYESAVLC